MRTHDTTRKSTLRRLISGAFVAAGLVAGSIAGGVTAASAASTGPCDRPEGIYMWSGDINVYAQNCRSTTVNLQFITVDQGTVTYRGPCSSVAPGATISENGGVPTLTAHKSWSYC